MNTRMGRAVLRLFVAGALGFLVLPLVAIIPLSLTDQRMLSMPVNSLSLQHYRSVMDNSDWLISALTSLKIASMSTLISVIVGTFAAAGCWMVSGAQIFRIIYLLPLIIPYVIVALGAYRLFAAIGLLDTVPGVVFAHVVGSVPFVFVAVSTSLQYVDKVIVKAARSLGAGPFRSAIKIVLPNAKAGILSGAIFAFLHSWDEIVVTLFVSGRSVQTLPRRMWEGLNDNLDPAIACVAVALIGVTVVLLVLEHMVSARRRALRV